MQQNTYVIVPPRPAPTSFADVRDVEVLDNGSLILKGEGWTTVFAPGTWTKATTLAEAGDPRE